MAQKLVFVVSMFLSLSVFAEGSLPARPSCSRVVGFMAMDNTRYEQALESFDHLPNTVREIKKAWRAMIVGDPAVDFALQVIRDVNFIEPSLIEHFLTAILFPSYFDMLDEVASERNEVEAYISTSDAKYLLNNFVALGWAEKTKDNSYVFTSSVPIIGLAIMSPPFWGRFIERRGYFQSAAATHREHNGGMLSETARKSLTWSHMYAFPPLDPKWKNATKQ